MAPVRPEALAPHQLSEQMPPAWSAGAAAMQQAGVKTAAVSEVQVRDEHEMDLERPSPQLTGRFTDCNTTRAHALDPYRARLGPVGLGVMLTCSLAIVPSFSPRWPFEP